MSKQKSVNSGAVTLMIGTLASRITGFLRQSLLNQLFDKEVTDAFAAARRVPNLFRELLAEGALSNSFVPIYNSLDKKEAKKLAAALFGLLLIANGILLVLAYIFTEPITNLLIGVNSNFNKELTMRFIRIVFPFLLSISLSSWVMGILNAEERFLAPAWAPVALNVVAVAAMLLFPQYSSSLAWGFVLGGVAQFLIQLPVLIKGRFVAALSTAWHPKLSIVLALLLPSVFTTSGRQILNVLSVRILGGLPQGSATGFDNAELFFSLVLGLFSISPALAYYSRLSHYAAKEPNRFAPTLLSGLRFIGIMTIPAGLLLSLLAKPVVEIVFNWFTLLGRHGAADAVINASVAALTPLGLAIFPVGLNNLFVRTFYIRKQVKLLITIILLTLSLQAFLYFVLSAVWGIAGLSWATVAVSWLQFFALSWLVHQREQYDIKSLLSFAIRAFSAAFLAFAISYLLLQALVFSSNWTGYLLTAIVGGLSFLFAYGFLARIFKIEEISALLAMARRRFRS